MRLSCVWLYVRSLDEARAFYEHALGMRVVFEDRTTGWVEFQADGSPVTIACQLLGLTAESSGPSAPNDEGGHTPNWPPRVVMKVDNLDDSLVQLRASGVTPDGGVQRVGSVKFVNLRDAAGNLIQLAEGGVPGEQ